MFLHGSTAHRIGINHCCSYVSVPEHFLNSSDVIVCLKKMAGEAVSERVGRRAFGQLASENG